MPRQRLPALHADESDIGKFFLQPAAERTVTDGHHAGRRRAHPHGLEGAHRKGHVLLRREPPDVQEHRSLVGGAPSGAQLRRAALRREQLGVDAAAHDRQALEPAVAELLPHGPGGREGELRLVVKAPQIVVDHRRQPAEPVIAAVLVEIRAEIRGHRNARCLRGPQRGPAQRTLGGHVHELRLGQGEACLQRAARGQADAQVGVHRDRAPQRAQLLRAVQRRLARLAGADQFDLMAALAEVANGSLHGQRHAVEFGRIRLGHIGNAHVGLSSGRESAVSAIDVPIALCARRDWMSGGAAHRLLREAAWTGISFWIA